MTVDFECTEEDVVELNRYFITTPNGKKEFFRNNARSAFWYFCLYVTIFAIVGVRSKWILPLWTVLLSAGLSIALLLYALLTRNAIQRKFTLTLIQRGNYKGILGKNIVALTPGGIVIQGPLCEANYPWKVIEEVRETKTHLYFRFSPVSFFLIPKRTFASAQQGAEFLRLGEKYRTEATGTPIPETTKGAWWTQSGVTEAEHVQKAGRS